MIKGAKKQMIVIRTGDSLYFDEAYFVLRRDLKESHGKSDILREANRILADSTDHARREKPRWRRWLAFGIGILCGAGGALLVCLLIL